MKFAPDNPILIAGGGIGGMALALALARKGIPVKLFEQAEKFSEVGAGIQLGPNATRILSQWGLDQKLSKCATEPDFLLIKNGKNNRELNRIPLKPLARELFGSSYNTIHRADLHGTLLEAVKETRTVELFNNFKVKNYSKQDNGNIQITAPDGKRHTGCALVGADGIWSTIRHKIHPDIQPKYSGRTAWRALVPLSDRMTELQNEVTLYMGPNCHLVHYPVKSGKYLNIVAVITDRETPDQQWDRTGNPSQLLTEFKSWSSDILDLLSSVETWTKWALFAHDCPENWSSGRITLLGDAVHPTLPFMAQGAVMAIEDANTLCAKILNGAGCLEERLIAYQKERIPRVSRVQKVSRQQGLIYHLTGPLAFARNQVISFKSPKSMLTDYQWLYGFRG